MKVAKFGGSSLADADQIKKVLSIIWSDSDRRHIVVSAPGKRNPEDRKITDLLYEWHRLNSLKLSTDEVIQIIWVRYATIVDELGLNLDLDDDFAVIDVNVKAGATIDYLASRGEYLCAKIVAKALKYTFVDAADYIHFDQNGELINTNEKMWQELRGQQVVMPGFYGSLLHNGFIKTFSRGGSDITGAILARALRADVYENWTDVSGLLMADPRIVTGPKKIDVVTYRELRELAYMGANVFHEEAMFPVQETGIPTNIRNTNDPRDEGTCIIADERKQQRHEHIITGIAGRKNFTVFTIEKKLMNQQVGFARRVLTVLEKNSISFEHMPSGIDTLSIIVDDKQLGEKSEKIKQEIKEACSPDTIEICPGMAMVAVVGKDMANTRGVASKVFTSLADNEINIRMINQGSSEISIIVGVENADYEKAVRAIYTGFVG